MNKKTPVLAEILVDVSLKHQYLIDKGDLFRIEEDQNNRGQSWLTYLGPVPKKLLRKIKAL